MLNNIIRTLVWSYGDSLQLDKYHFTIVSMPIDLLMHR